jgi:hypothetical protein
VGIENCRHGLGLGTGLVPNGLGNPASTTYVNNLRTTGVASSPATTQRTATTRPRNHTRECNIRVASASSSSDPESAPRHRATEAQRRARLEELAKARCQLDEELAILHRELGQDPEPRDWQPVQMVPVQEQPRERNGERWEHRPAAEQPRGRDSTPSAP